jgi:LPS export ABC transporter protein LptC
MRSAAQRSRALTRGLVAFAAVLAAGALAYRVLVGGDAEEFETTIVDDGRGYYLVDTRLTELGPDGAPRVVLRADSIEQRLSDDSVLLSNLSLDYSTPEAGLWTLTAASGRMPVTRGTLLLSGGVRVEGEQSSESAVILTDQLSYDVDKGLVQTAEPVTVQFGNHSLEGRGLRVVLKEGTLRLESNVHGRFIP